MTDKDNKPTEPIRDGDSRPDQNLTGKKKPDSPLATGKKISKARGADVNTSEDYKDANP